MTIHVEATFDVTSWDEKTAEGLDGAVKVTRATFGQQLSGGIEAGSLVDAVMVYREDGTADFLGLQRVVGRIGDRAGSFVLTYTGGYDGTEARATLAVVAGSGTGDLVGLRGTGNSGAGAGDSGVLTLDYDLD